MPKTLVKRHFWSQIPVLPKRHNCAALAAVSPNRCFAKVPKTPIKQHFDIAEPRNSQRIDKLYDRNLDVQIFQKAQGELCRALAADRLLSPSRSCVLRGLSSWGLKNMTFSYIWRLLQYLQKPSFATVHKTCVKPHFRSKIGVLPKLQNGS